MSRCAQRRRIAAARSFQEKGVVTRQEVKPRLGVLRPAEGDGLTVLLEAWQRRPHRWERVHEAARWLNQRCLYKARYRGHSEFYCRNPST